MKRIITTFAALAMSAAFTIAADEAKKPEAAPAAGAEKKADPEKAFARKDKDNDGNLTKEEFVAGAKDAAKAEAAFAKRDANGDGKISKEEFAAQPAKKK
jgi:Ca2+-binding EF-hand superfamily protein